MADRRPIDGDPNSHSLALRVEAEALLAQCHLTAIAAFEIGKGSPELLILLGNEEILTAGLADSLARAVLRRVVVLGEDEGSLGDEGLSAGPSPSRNLSGYFVSAPIGSGAVVTVALSATCLDAEQQDVPRAVCYYLASKLALTDIITTDERSCVSRLTSRQEQCLHWAALGKSDWEIGKVLGLSRHTVHRHIEAAKKRLHVFTRVQAIVALGQRHGDWQVERKQLDQGGQALKQGNGHLRTEQRYS